MTAGQSLSGGTAGTCLLHIERARNGDDAELWARAHTALQVAVADGVSIASVACLYFGAPALSFVLHGAADHPGLDQALATVDAGTTAVTRRRLEDAHRRIDRRERPLLAEFDLINGLSGLGVVLRRRRNLGLLRDVLDYLVRLTEPVDGLPGWWCPTGPHRNRPGPRGGHGNNGIAHGITGPLALLALCLHDGIEVEGHREAITRICRWLDAWEQQTDNGTWWPEIVTLHDLHRNTTSQPGPLRPSWCYGTPGITRAQQLAARAVKDPARQHKAETAFTACITDPAQTGRLTDRSLCHGTAGLLATGRRLAADALRPIPLAPLLHLHWQAPAPPGEPPGFLEGAAGADLALLGTATTLWDACLLLC